IALQERGPSQGELDVLFLDKQADYRWHGNTLVTQSELQISFLKDLVTLRNPTSPYSFVNYLKHHGRLVDFINLGTFYPCRMEYNDYLRWVAGQFTGQSRYGEEVLTIEPVLHNQQVEALRVISRDTQGLQHVRTTRSVVVSAGGTPRIPEAFKALKDDGRVFHHSQYLERMATQPCVNNQPMSIAIIGGGQSAAEAFIDLNDSFPSVQVDMILRGSALKPADDSPFVNEVFSPEFTDLVFQQASSERERLVNEYHNTNYSVVDIDLIERIYGIFYRQKVSGIARHAFRTLTTVEKAIATERGIELTVRNNATGEVSVRRYDAVVLATGYERQMHRKLLAPLEQYLGDFEVDRNYRLITDERCKAGIYMQG
ncbi:MAG TPA: SidA/IucD/PvdA family monooxygenase, partial [Pseudomonas sp.]|nr:SidA/IucD/PvdA family monooxygenase [Pseudomonas sp.]